MYSKEELKNLKLEFWESFAAFCEVQPYRGFTSGNV